MLDNLFFDSIDKFVLNSPLNQVTCDKAYRPDIAGMTIFNTPVVGFASADDEMFSALLAPEIGLEEFDFPNKWLEGAGTVISFFLPFTKRIRKSNAEKPVWPSDEWLNGRIEGQAFVIELCRHIASLFSEQGYNSVIPSFDKRFWYKAQLPETAGNDTGIFTSNWSERHVAYVCGLGSFSISANFITEKGTAGRFGSLITNYHLPEKHSPNRPDVFGNCILCGACIKNCHTCAISKQNGKNHIPCKLHLDETRKSNPPYYGCGKCQVNVPCEAQNPRKNLYN